MQLTNEVRLERLHEAVANKECFAHPDQPAVYLFEHNSRGECTVPICEGCIPICQEIIDTYGALDANSQFKVLESYDMVCEGCGRRFVELDFAPKIKVLE